MGLTPHPASRRATCGKRILIPPFTALLRCDCPTTAAHIEILRFQFFHAQRLARVVSSLDSLVRHRTNYNIKIKIRIRKVLVVQYVRNTFTVGLEKQPGNGSKYSVHVELNKERNKMKAYK
jgi:hypothetical protein